MGLTATPSSRPDGVRQTGFPLLVALCFAAGGLYGWSAVIPALNAAFDITTEQAGLVFSIAIVVFTVAVYLVPRLPGGFRNSRAAALFGLVGVVALAVAASAGSFMTFLVAFAIGFGAVSGAIYVLCITAAARHHRPDVATPIAIAAFGLGGATFGPAMRFLVADGWGLGALYLLAAALAATSIAVLFAGGRSGETRVDDGTQGQPTSAATQRASPLTVTLLFCAFAAGSFAGLMVLGLATSILESRGAAVWLSGLALFGVAVGNTGGRLSVGFLTRVMSPGAIVVASPLVAGSGALLALLAPSPMSGAIALTIIAAGYGLMASGLPTLTRAFTGAERFARVFSVVFIAWGCAGLLAPWVAGRLFDVFGDFAPAFVLAIVASLVSVACALVLHRRLAAVTKAP